MNNLIKKKSNNENILFSKKEELVNTKKKTFFAISSLDRDWYNTSETPFNFKVKFNDMDNCNYINIPNNIKNIVSIRLERAILPNKNLNITYTTNKISLDNYPFILVEVGNINNVIDGTNNMFGNSLGIMNSITPISKSYNENRYLEFKNINYSIKEYYDNPISSFSNFDVKIKNQQGNDIIEIQDVLTIDKIYANDNDDVTQTDDYLKIKTTEYFGSEYQIGDVIIIKNYIFRDTEEYTINSTLFNSFINRKEGHKIIALSSFSGSPLSHYNNQIAISIPHTISKTSGTLVVDSWYGDSTGSLIESTTIDSSSSDSDTSGKLINTNLQTNLFINF